MILQPSASMILDGRLEFGNVKVRFSWIGELIATRQRYAETIAFGKCRSEAVGVTLLRGLPYRIATGN